MTLTDTKNLFRVLEYNYFFRNLLVICKKVIDIEDVTDFLVTITSLYKQKRHYFLVYNKVSQYPFRCFLEITVQLFSENISSEIVKPCCTLRNNVALACKEMLNNAICITLHVLLAHRATNVKGRTIEQFSHIFIRFELSSFLVFAIATHWK